MFVLGALPGAINVLGWQFLNTYCAIIQGNFRNSHAGCHSIADMANVVGGVWLKEIVGVLFLVTYAIVGASGIFGTSVAFNALSNHAICTNYFMLVATVAVFILASARKFEKIAWLTWAGFLSVYVAVFIVVYVPVNPSTPGTPLTAFQTTASQLRRWTDLLPPQRRATSSLGITSSVTQHSSRASPPSRPSSALAPARRRSSPSSRR